MTEPRVFTPEEAMFYQAAVRTDTPQGFATFYALITGRPLPAHAAEWIGFIYAEGVKAGRDLLIEAFRGSTKTTTVTRLFLLYQIGLHPERSNMLIQASEDSAALNAGEVARTIEHNPAWKMLFPEIMPDRDVRWGADGYFVKRADMDYGEWTRLRDEWPTFVGYGYTSKAIIGKHPNGLLIVDDIYDYENTTSDREMLRVENIYNGVILYCKILPTRMINIFTPWKETDMNMKNKASGKYAHILTVGCNADVTAATWPEGFPIEAVRAMRDKDVTGGIEFARMVQCNLRAAANRVFVYTLYPSHLIQPTWTFVGGVDYAAVANPNSRGARGQSYFALAYVAKVPGGGAAVFDGVLAQCSQGEAEEYTLRAQNLFPAWQWCVIEGDGKGEEFFELIRRHPEMKLTPIPPKTDNRPKAERLVKGVGPWLRNGMVKISDGSSPFLDALRHWLNLYPNVDQHDPGWDAADAVYWALRGMPDVLTMASREEELPPWGKTRRQRVNPYAALAKQRA